MLLALLIAAPGSAADAARGEILAGLGGCPACHTADDGPPYAGGHAIETKWGTFYGTNLTPDPTTGLGGWDEDDFVRAMRRGRSPDRSLWPAFPFAFFTRMTEADLADVWAYLQTLAPIERADTPHDIRPGGLARWAWHTFAFSPHHFHPPTGDPVLDRGAYLAEVVGHCQGCHTPRTALGKPSRRHAYAGAEGPPYDTPNLTPHADGRAGWTANDWTWFFQSGILPDGDSVGSGMSRVVREGTSQLTPADREALAAWMMSLPPKPSASPGPE